MPTTRAVPVLPSALKPGDRVGQYEILERLAEGGMGCLYKVRQGTGVYVLKILKGSFLDDAVESEEQRQWRLRADREFAALKAVEHPHVQRGYAFERWPELNRGWPCIVTEYIDGDELSRWRAAAAPSLRRILQLLTKLADALAHIHAAGLFHRDIKAPNILVRRGTDEPVLIDLGVARHVAREPVTQHCEFVGTDTHCAPEYVAHLDSPAGLMGEPFSWTGQVDLYTFGYVAYELLANRPPVIAPGGSHALLSSIKNDPVPHVCEVNTAVPPAVGLLVMRLLEKDPSLRPRTAEEVRDAFQDLVEAHAAEADERDEPFPVPAPPPELATRRVRRTPKRPSFIPSSVGPMRAEITAGGAITLDEEDAPGPADAEAGDEAADEDLPSAIRGIRKQLDEAAPPLRPYRRVAILGSAVVALLVLFLVARSSTKNSPKGEDLPARTSRGATTERAAPSSPLTAAIPPAPSGASTPRPAAVPPLPSGDIDAAIAARYGRPTVPPRGSAAPSALAAASAGASQPADEGPLLRSVRVDVPPRGDGSGPRKYGVPMGAHLRARLLSNLDSRTIAGGPVEATLTHPYLVRGQVVLPARTMLYGRASDAGGRFSVRFSTLRLPDDTEVPFDGLAMDRGDNKPGLAASGRLAPSKDAAGDGLSTKIARGTGNLLLNTVTGGLAEDAVRNAGSAALNHRETDAYSGGGSAILLDAGASFVVWVSKGF